MRLRSPVTLPLDLIWSIIGLLLTIGGTLLEASIASPVWSWGGGSMRVYSLGVTYQIGAVFFVACMGGKNAGALSQIAYLVLGLMGFEVFTQGGGLDYFLQPTFGYLLGFVPAGWLCGWLAFRAKPQVEVLTLSCLVGLTVIHGVGLLYLGVAYGLGWADVSSLTLVEAVMHYSITHLPAQAAIACAASVFAFCLRRVLLY